MTLTLLQLVDSPKFADFLATTKSWKNHTNLKIIFGEVVRELTNIDHDDSCDVKSITRLLKEEEEEQEQEVVVVAFPPVQWD